MMSLNSMECTSTCIFKKLLENSFYYDYDKDNMVYWFNTPLQEYECYRFLLIDVVGYLK